MRHRVATLTVLALVAIAGSSSSAPPDRPPARGDERKPEPPSECKGWPCKVSPYEGNLPAHYALDKMKRLGCDPPFDHGGGLKEGQTAWVGFSCPAHVAREFKGALHADFSDACLPKRPGRVYVPVFEATCGVVKDWPQDGPIAETARKLGCGPLMKYQPGSSSGFLGGVGSYCPDTKAVREAPGGMHLGFPSGYCDGCLKVPQGQIFRFWTTEIGPNCPGGCAHPTGPTQI